MADIAIFRINYKSDFILTLNSDAGWLTPFCIKFWTGAPSQAYYAYYDGMSYTHCAPVEGEPTKLLVQFDDHHLTIGDLKFQIGYHFTVDDFPTTVEDEVINQASVIIEVDDAPAQVMLDLNGETAPEIEFSLPAYANEAQRIANEEARIAAEQQRIANEEARIAAETIRQQNEQQRIDQETARVNEFATLKSQSQAATRDANAAATLANEKAQLAADKAALAQQKAEYAQQQGGYAKDQGDYAKNQGNYAKEQGEIAQADHERAEADHGIAVDDHTQAGNDHTRAESDHTRAESDHAAVEVYVDSLGAFDISAYNATGGVLAKYADLTAALGTNGANIPDALRKGGMSVKFVLSSDNNYVQYRYMLPYAGNTTAENNKFVNPTNWQGVDDVPTAGSDNLVKSGGVKNVCAQINEKIINLTSIPFTLESYAIDQANLTSIGTVSNYKHYCIKVSEGQNIRIGALLYARSLYYAFLNTKPVPVSGGALDFTVGYDKAIFFRDMVTEGWVYKDIVIPAGCNYLWVDANANVARNSCSLIGNRLDTIPSIIDNTYSFDKNNGLSANAGRQIVERYLNWKVFRSSYNFNLSYAIQADGKLGKNATYKHANIKVQAGDVYRIDTTDTLNRTFRYAFLTTDNYPKTSGATLPLVEGTVPTVYYLSNSAPYSAYITIPDGCTVLAFDLYSTVKTKLYKYAERDNIKVPAFYESYIKAKADVLLERDIMAGKRADSMIFFSDYHVTDNVSYDHNYAHSPALIKYLTEKTNTKTVFFGGDVFASPEGDNMRIKHMLEFSRLFSPIKMYSVVGNHEWRQSSQLNTQTSPKYVEADYNSLIKPFEKEVHVGKIDNVEKPWYYFDNEAKKIRYVCLYAINPSNESSYAYGLNYNNTQLAFLDECCNTLSNDWRIVVIQHIVYQNGTNPVYVNQMALKLYLTDVGSMLYTKVRSVNSDDTKPNIVLILSGHTHVDFGEFVDDKCFSYIITCDATYALPSDGDYSSSSRWVPPTNGCRLPNTVFEQAFDVIHLLPESNMIMGERIGWGCNSKIHTNVNSVPVGLSMQLYPTIGSNITWVSHDDDIATVDDTGLVTGVANGDVTIKCFTPMINTYESDTDELEKNGYVEYFHVKVVS